MIIWFTGVSGAGKTTLGKKFFKVLKKKSQSSIFIDGDEFRSIFKKDLKYSLKDRDKNAFRLTRLVQSLSKQKINIVVAANLTSFKYRSWCRKKISNYFEIYIKAKKTSLLKRDYKKLYKNAIQGKIKNVVGVDLPFNTPRGCNLYIENNLTKNELYKNIERIFKKIKKSKIKIY